MASYAHIDREASRELLCRGAGPWFELRDVAVPTPGRSEVVVRVHATSVNPIDVKRAEGYGRRLLALRGASPLPRVLGNDLVGTVISVGASVTSFQCGDRVFGLVPTGPRGAHVTHAVTDAKWLKHAPHNTTDEQLAVLPYSFTTMWRAVSAIRLDASTSPGRRVAVLGAGGALGRLSLGLLATWGAEVVAIASEQHHEACIELGAREVLAPGAAWQEILARSCHAAFNFASWKDDPRLSLCLLADALGQVTTVHPLMRTFDYHGWVGGALRSLGTWRSARARVRARAPSARYVWTVFAPEGIALDALCRSPPLLPIGIRRPLDAAGDAFAHIARGLPGRAVLAP